MSVVNDKTKPLPCPPTFIKYPLTLHRKPCKVLLDLLE